MDPSQFRNSENYLDPLILAIRTSTNDNELFNKVPSFSKWPARKRNEHKLFHTLLDPTYS
jgi:hypothetical protein